MAFPGTLLRRHPGRCGRQLALVIASAGAVTALAGVLLPGDCLVAVLVSLPVVAVVEGHKAWQRR